jgi:hypothetical protein
MRGVSHLNFAVLSPIIKEKNFMSYIKIQCEDCEKVHQIHRSEMEYEPVDSEVREMGEEITYKGNIGIECDCGKAIKINHYFWEYPEGIENHKATEVSGGTPVENTL